jgi:hypothetical protein
VADLDEPELHFGEHVVVPDLAGWRRERMRAMPRQAFFTLAPDWVCEVLSPSTERADRGRKLRIYAEAGVAHVWFLKPADRTLEVLRLRGRVDHRRRLGGRSRRPCGALPGDHWNSPLGDAALRPSDPYERKRVIRTSGCPGIKVARSSTGSCS